MSQSEVMRLHFPRPERRPLTLDDLAVIYIIEPGDTLQTLEAARGWPFDCWEFITDRGGWYEAVFIISDDGFGLVLLAEVSQIADQCLMTACRNAALQIDSTAPH